MCFGLVEFSIAANVLDRCKYFGCSLIVQGIKYVVFLLLWGAVGVLSISVIGPEFFFYIPASYEYLLESSFRWRFFD